MKAGLVDLDDTLVCWPKHLFAEIAQKAMKNLGEEIDLETAHTITRFDYNYLRQKNIPPEKFWIEFNKYGYAGRLDALQSGRATMMPGAHRLLINLREKGYFLALVTNSPEAPGRLALSYFGLQGYFDAFSFTNNDRIEKPNPELARRALRGIKDLESVFIVGDSTRDIIMGKKLGATTIHLETKNPAIDCGADYCVKSLDEVINILK